MDRYSHRRHQTPARSSHLIFFVMGLLVLAMTLIVSLAEPAVPTAPPTVVVPDHSSFEVIRESMVAQCGEGGVYLHVRDVNPETEAAVYEYGHFTVIAEAPVLLPPSLVIVKNDTGEIASIYVIGVTVERLVDIDTLRQRYPDPCSLPSPAGRT